MMKIGMLWFDNSQDPLPQKINRAIQHYNQTRPTPATCVFMNDKQYPQLPEIPGLALKTSRSILPNHYWVGVES